MSVCPKCGGYISDSTNSCYAGRHCVCLSIVAAPATPDNDPRRYGKVTLPQQGCICPPGANLTCEALMCPRQRHDQIGRRIKS